MSTPVLTLVLGLTFVTLVLAYVLWCFPWLTRYWYPRTYHMRVSPGTLLLVVSDIHYNFCDPMVSTVGDLARVLGVKYVVIAGDLIEYRTRVTIEELRKLLSDVLRTLHLTNFSGEVVYVRSMTSHDPIPPREELRVEVAGTRVWVLTGILVIETSGPKIYVLHGDYLCRNGFLAHLVNRLLGPLLLERVGRVVLGLHERDWLIMGHTHIPGLDSGARVANCGCWMRKFLRNWVTRTGILVEVTEEDVYCTLIEVPQFLKIYSSLVSSSPYSSHSTDKYSTQVVQVSHRRSST